MGGCSPPSFPVKGDTNFHSLQSRGIRSVPASIKTENAHGNRQVLPETAECVSQNKGGSSIVTQGDSGPVPTRWQLVGGISAELGGFRAAAPPGRSRRGSGRPCLPRDRKQPPSAPGAGDRRATGLGTEKCDHRPPPVLHTTKEATPARLLLAGQVPCLLPSFGCKYASLGGGFWSSQNGLLPGYCFASLLPFLFFSQD